MSQESLIVNGEISNVFKAYTHLAKGISTVEFVDICSFSCIMRIESLILNVDDEKTKKFLEIKSFSKYSKADESSKRIIDVLTKNSSNVKLDGEYQFIDFPLSFRASQTVCFFGDSQIDESLTTLMLLNNGHFASAKISINDESKILIDSISIKNENSLRF
jgi:hypothetical protein